jgi:hypothetical protein
MSNILKELGIDEDDVKWYHLSACINMPLNWFYDDYENDKILANTVDELCMNCPVAKQCFKEGIDDKEFAGVRGGVYFNIGRIDKQNNSHKTKETWQRLKKIHGKDFL